MKLPPRSAFALVAGTAVLASLVSATSANAAGSDLPNHFSRLILCDTQDTANGYIGVQTNLTAQRSATLDGAEDFAGSNFFDEPRVDTTDQSISDLESGNYLEVDPNVANGIRYNTDGTGFASPEQSFDVSKAGIVTSQAGGYLGFDDASGKLAIVSTPRYKVCGSATGETPTRLVAHVDSVDAAAGSAIISGTAQSSILDDVRISVGTSWVSTSAIGGWVLNVGGLKPGKQTVTIEQSVNNVAAPNRSLEIDLGGDSGSGATDPFSLTSPTDNGTATTPTGNVTFTGKGTTGATVQVTTVGGNPNRDLFQAPATVDNKGNWTGIGWLNNQNGKYALDVKYTLNGATETKRINITVTDGTSATDPFSLTSPTDNGTATTPTGNVTFTGKGTTGATVQVTTVGGNPNRDLFQAPATVDNKGNWTGIGWLNNQNGKYTLDVVYTLKGVTETERISITVTK